jgi:hypothetical protein
MRVKRKRKIGSQKMINKAERKKMIRRKRQVQMRRARERKKEDKIEGEEV